MKILFVDDEPRILEGITRMLFHLADEWDMTCVESGQAALEELENSHFDVVVSDMRMPGMDGVAVLKEVREKYPNVVRIILSGHSDEQAAIDVVPFAHQFLSKPCDAEELQEVVERACGLQEILNYDTIRRTVGEIDKLPSLPQVYTELTKVLVNPNAGADDVAVIISKDPAMSAKILQLVNSSFFARATRVTSVGEAVMHMGFEMVKTLALSVEIFKSQADGKLCEGFSLEALQRHSLHSAAIAAKLLPERRLSELAFMAAMLHDIGKLIMASRLPDKLKAAMKLAKDSEISLHQAEMELYGVSHAEIGAYLLGLWGLPYAIVEAVANHHDPMRVPQRKGFGVLSAVYIANCLSNGYEFDMEYLALLGVSDQIDSWRDLAAEAA